MTPDERSEMQAAGVAHMGLDEAIGLRVDTVEADRVAGSFQVTAKVLGRDGSVHRGVLSSVIESIASVAGAAHLGAAGRVVGVTNSTSYFASVASGSVTVVAEPVSRQMDRQHWVVRVTDERGGLLAQGNVQLANLLDGKQPSP
jgi:1,4-dihydroxy-2-naphthoyl-CoA hydrolase